jgi:5-methylcytosine-specific restriction protein A
MPPRAKRGCRAPMCPGLTQERHGYCAQHESLASGWNAPSRGTAEQRGYGYEWRKLARSILRRDGFRCRCLECAELGRALPATEVDHRIPKAEGGTDDPLNLFAIHADCHKRKTQRESQRAQHGAP